MDNGDRRAAPGLDIFFKISRMTGASPAAKGALEVGKLDERDGCVARAAARSHYRNLVAKRLDQSRGLVLGSQRLQIVGGVRCRAPACPGTP